MTSQVPSAQRGLTAVFGMGTGGTLSPSSPETVCNCGIWGAARENLAAPREGNLRGDPPRRAGSSPRPDVREYPRNRVSRVSRTLKTAQPLIRNKGTLCCLTSPGAAMVSVLGCRSCGHEAPHYKRRLVANVSDQALDRLVSSSCTHCCASTDDLSPHRL